MVQRDIRRSGCPLKIMLVLAFLIESSLAGCNNNSMSDFAKRQQLEQNAVDALTRLGAKVKKRDTETARGGWVVDLSHVPITPEIAGQLKLLESSTGVLILSKTAIDDSQLADLIDRKILHGVVELDLSHNAAITDQSLDKLAGLLFLSDLNLVGTHVTEAGIARFQEQRQAMTSKMEDNSALSKVVKKKCNIHH